MARAPICTAQAAQLTIKSLGRVIGEARCQRSSHHRRRRAIVLSVLRCPPPCTARASRPRCTEGDTRGAAEQESDQFASTRPRVVDSVQVSYATCHPDARFPVYSRGWGWRGHGLSAPERVAQSVRPRPYQKLQRQRVGLGSTPRRADTSPQNRDSPLRSSPGPQAVRLSTQPSVNTVQFLYRRRHVHMMSAGTQTRRRWAAAMFWGHRGP